VYKYRNSVHNHVENLTCSESAISNSDIDLGYEEYVVSDFDNDASDSGPYHRERGVYDSCWFTGDAEGPHVQERMS